jgi:vacuolar-type H+-ATPase subunit E/Vma4
MSTNQMENKLIDKTVEQRHQLIADAQEKADKIISAMEAETKRINEMTDQAIQNVIGGELRSVHDRVVGGAQLQGRKIIMEARMEVISKVFDLAAEEVKKIPESLKYNEYLEKMAVESINKLNEDCIVYANPADAKHLSSVMEKLSVGVKVKIEESPVDIIGGISLVNMEGTKTIHNTLDSRLKEARNKLIAEVADTLGVI